MTVGRPLRVLSSIALVVVMLSSAVADTPLSDKQQQLQGLNSQIIGEKTRLKALLDQEQALKTQIGSLDAQLAYVAQSIQTEQAKLDELSGQVDAAKAELAAREAELNQHLEDFGNRMRFMYKSGRISGIELVFSANNFVDLMNRALFFSAIVREDNHEVDTLRQERAAVAAVKTDLEGKQAEQAATVKTIRDQQAQLQAVRAERVDAMQKIAALGAQIQRELDAMEAQREVLQAQIARLITESLRARSSGKWIWPMDGVITQGFGCSPYVFEPYDPNCPSRHFHSGIDIANEYGTPVHAADGGILHNFIMTCSWNPNWFCGYGRYVIVVHAGGFTSLYGHLSAWALPDGTEILKDTVIGYEGSTGNSTGPHLHFEIDLSGTPVDPLAYLP